VSTNVDVILVKDFPNSTDVLVWQSSLFCNQISSFKDHAYSSLIVKTKSENVCFLKYFLKFKLLWSKTQHTIQCSSLIVLYFENRNRPVARLKWLIFSWFFVSILNSDFGYIFFMVCDEVTFCKFQGKQKA
jgi:hypothetical protein